MSVATETGTSSPNETQITSPALISPVNENFFRLTEKGRCALEVVRLNNSLRNHNNPEISFAMIPEQIELVAARKEELCRKLDMPEDEGERAAIIAGFQQELETHGFPHWRVVSEK